MSPVAKMHPKGEGRKIIGFSLSPELARKVKIEAARRQISLKRLFEEMWILFEKHGGKKKT
jgi:hypothetical protein